MMQTLLLSLFSIASGITGPQPKWFDNMLAGYLLGYDGTRSNIGVYDKGKGHYLIRNVECDGGHLMLILTRDRRIIEMLNYDAPNYKHKKYPGEWKLVEKKLPSLSTGKGVKIGSTPSALTAKLGKPTEIKRTGKSKQYTEYRYIWTDTKNGEGTESANVYTFKSGKLIEISFYKDAIPGCGGGTRPWEYLNKDM